MYQEQLDKKCKENGLTYVYSTSKIKENVWVSNITILCLDLVETQYRTMDTTKVKAEESVAQFVLEDYFNCHKESC